jgi:hypothetical protein
MQLALCNRVRTRGRKMGAASIQRTLAALAVAACLFGPTSIATAETTEAMHQGSDA